MSHEAERSRLDVSIEPAFCFRETDDGVFLDGVAPGGDRRRAPRTNARTRVLLRRDWFCFRTSGITDASIDASIEIHSRERASSSSPSVVAREDLARALAHPDGVLELRAPTPILRDRGPVVGPQV